MDRIIEKLQIIKELFSELRKTKPDTLEYLALLKRIRLQSAEYQTLVDKKNNSRRSRKLRS
jgi:hypothetical protein